MDLLNNFENYLSQRGISRKTLRNYRCDLLHFTGWACFHLETKGYRMVNNIQDLLPHLNFELFTNYKTYHLLKNIPASTANRRLSTLRNFGKFLVFEGLTAIDPTQVVQNIKSTKAQKEENGQERMEQVLAEFKKFLEEQKLSKATMKNYLSDTRQFIQYVAQQTGGR